MTSLVEEFNWERDRIHLRTSIDTKDSFYSGWTELSVINYGILWRWLTTKHDWTKLYGGIILDEFADLTPQRELAARLIFDEQKALKQRERFHIVATSSSITPDLFENLR